MLNFSLLTQFFLAKGLTATKQIYMGIVPKKSFNKTHHDINMINKN